MLYLNDRLPGGKKKLEFRKVFKEGAWRKNTLEEFEKVMLGRVDRNEMQMDQYHYYGNEWLECQRRFVTRS
jgi:hypothetical protein